MIATQTEYLELIKNRKWRLLKRSLQDLDANEAADLVEDSSKENKIILFRLLTRRQTKEVFKCLPHSEQETIIEGLRGNLHKLTSLLNDIEPDDRTAFFEELPGDIAQKLIQQLTPEEQKVPLQLLSYPKDSIGRLMTPEFVAIKANFTIAEAFAHIRKHGKQSETLNIIYIIDENWKLIDDIDIKELILANPDELISDMIDHRFVYLNALDDQEMAIQVFKDYDRAALPVLSKSGVLLGIVTFDDIMDVI